MTDITATTLRCGMPLLVETIPGVRSAAMTWLIPAGTSREPEGQQGLATMHTEMLARGAGNFDSRAQADAYDTLGASRGFSVGTFHLAFTGIFLGSRMADALPLFVENVRAPRFDPASFEPSRDLCLQSIESLKDDPHDRVLISARQHHEIGRASCRERV